MKKASDVASDDPPDEALSCRHRAWDVPDFEKNGVLSQLNLAHRNRSDFCDLRSRCPSRTPEIARFPRQEKAMLHCDLRVRWKVASDLRFRAAISEPKTPFFLRDFWRFGPVNADIASDCDCAIWCAKHRKIRFSKFPGSGLKKI